MNWKGTISTRLPKPVASIARRVYYSISDEKPDRILHDEFVDSLFGEQRYNSYIQELGDSPLFEAGMEKYSRLQGNRGGVDGNVQDYYALIREINPDVVVETGVCNGLSTLTILTALEKNGRGQLVSVDYPYHADESLEEFRSETFQSYGGAAIPADKEPGWIVPEKLKVRWRLETGRSQEVLPEIKAQIETIDMFFHDSEHSMSCMMFEYETAWSWMEEGMLVSDDIRWNNAFARFTEERAEQYGKIDNNTGFVMKG